MNTLHRKSFIFIASTLLISTFLMAQTAFAQEKETGKKVRVKVITVKDGEETIFDTTFKAEDFDKEPFRKEMKEKYGIELEELEAEEGVKVRVDSGKADAVGVETKTETKNIVVVKEISADSDEDMIWEEKAGEPDSAEMMEKVYIINSDGETFTISEGGEKDKVIRIVTEEGEQKVIKEVDGKKVILITEEGEMKVIKDEGGEKVIMIKVDEDKCDKTKKDKKLTEETIKVIVITDDEDKKTQPEKK